MRRLLDNTYALWALLALPGLWILAERLVLHGHYPFLKWTGLWSAWLLVATMMVTPLQLLFGPLPWLRKRRRYLGVASFGYAVLHLLVWLMAINFGALLRSFTRFEIVTGWVAMAIMLLLAATSTDGAVRRLGPRWKALQRWVYPAAVLTLVHWILTTDDRITVLVSCAALAGLSVWRILRHRARRSSPAQRL